MPRTIHTEHDAVKRLFPPNVCVITPPPQGRCCHCGAFVAPGQHAAAHIIGGSVEMTGRPIFWLANHCNDCYETGACEPDEFGASCVPLQEGE